MAIVYKHIRKDTEEIFYIGIGKTEKRAYSKLCRSMFWKRIVEKTEYEVVILKSDITWEEAQKLETELITKYGRRDLGLGTLVNLTNGGQGTIGRVFNKDKIEFFRERRIGSNNPMYGRKGEEHPNFGKTKELCPNYGKKWSENRKDKYKSLGYKTSARPVVHLLTGTFYDSVRDAAIAFNYKEHILRTRLNGKFFNNTNIIYV